MSIFNKQITFLSSISNKQIIRIIIICFCLMIIVNIINDKWPFKGATFILIYIPIIWAGVTLPVLSGIAKVVSSEVEMKKKMARFVIVLGIIMIIITFFGPLILYYLQLQNLKEIERLKQVIQQHQ